MQKNGEDLLIYSQVLLLQTKGRVIFFSCHQYISLGKNVVDFLRFAGG
jgi:hypothetical protein